MFKKINQKSVKAFNLKTLLLIASISFIVLLTVIFSNLLVSAEEVAYTDANFTITGSVEFNWNVENKKPTWNADNKSKLICAYQGTDTPFNSQQKLKPEAKIKIVYKFMKPDGSFVEVEHDEWVTDLKLQESIESFGFGLTNVTCVITPKTNGDTFTNGLTQIQKEIKVYSKMSIQEAVRVAARGNIPKLNLTSNIWTYEYEISTIYDASSPEQTILTYYTGFTNRPIFIYSQAYLEARFGEEIFGGVSYDVYVGIEKFRVKNDAEDNSLYDKLIYKGNPANKDIYLCNDIDNNTINSLEGTDPGAYTDLGYNAKTNDYIQEIAIANSFVSILILPEPVLYTFSTMEQQAKYLEFNDSMQAPKTMAEMEALFQSLFDINDGLYRFKCLQAQKTLKIAKFGDKYKATINLRDSVQLLTEDRIGKIYDRQDNEVVKLKSKISSEPVDLEYSVLGSSVGIIKGTNFMKVIPAGEYVIEVKVKNSLIYKLTNENNYYLVPSVLKISVDKVKGEFEGSVADDTYVMHGLVDLDDPALLNKYNVSLASNKGVQFNKIYIVSKAPLPDFEVFPAQKLVYDGEAKPVQISKYIIQDTIQFKTKYVKITNGIEEAINDENVNINGPKNAGLYLATVEITDPNYVLVNHIKTIEFEIKKAKFAVYSVSVSEMKGEYKDRDGSIKNGKYTIVEFGLAANEVFVSGGDIYFCIDSGSHFSNDIKDLINLKRGKHKIAIYSISENFALSESMKPTVEYMNFEVPDTRSVPLLGGFLGGLLPSIANYNAMVAFLVGMLLLIIAIIFILRSLVLRRRAKKGKVKKVKKEKKYDSFYNEKISAKKAKAEEKKLQKSNKRKEKIEKIDEEIEKEETVTETVEPENVE